MTMWPVSHRSPRRARITLPRLAIGRAAGDEPSSCRFNQRLRFLYVPICEMLNGGNRYLDDDPKMISGVGRRGVSPEAQEYAIASGLNELLLEGARDCPGMGNTRGARATIQFAKVPASTHGLYSGGIRRRRDRSNRALPTLCQRRCMRSSQPRTPGGQQSSSAPPRTR